MKPRDKDGVIYFRHLAFRQGNENQQHEAPGISNRRRLSLKKCTQVMSGALCAKENVARPGDGEAPATETEKEVRVSPIPTHVSDHRDPSVSPILNERTAVSEKVEENVVAMSLFDHDEEEAEDDLVHELHRITGKETDYANKIVRKLRSIFKKRHNGAHLTCDAVDGLWKERDREAGEVQREVYEEPGLENIHCTTAKSLYSPKALTDFLTS